MRKNIRVPKFFRSFYFVVGFLLFLWLLFFDTNDLVNQMRMNSKINELENDLEFYTEKTTEIEKARESLETDPKLREKFARERHLMKKDGEDVYLIVKEDK